MAYGASCALDRGAPEEGELMAQGRARFTLDPKGVEQLLKGPETRRMLAKAAGQVQSRLGEGHDTQVNVGKSRARATVMAKSPRARARQRKHRTMEKAVGGGLNGD